MVGLVWFVVCLVVGCLFCWLIVCLVGGLVGVVVDRLLVGCLACLFG